MITVTIGVPDLEVFLGVLLAIDKDALRNLELGFFITYERHFTMYIAIDVSI